MRFYGAAILVATLGCTSRGNVSVPAEVPKPESMALMGRYGVAHACPVGSVILTAGHVASRDVFGQEFLLGYVYTQRGRKGYLSGALVLYSRDVAVLKLDAGDAPVFYGTGATPVVGDKVYWQEYDLNSGLKIVQKTGTVSVLGPGNFTFVPAPAQGASGGCVFDSANKAIGIVVWSVGLSKFSGVAVDLTGEAW